MDLISQKLKNEINIIVAIQLSHIYCVDDKPVHCSLLHVFTRAATSSHFKTKSLLHAPVQCTGVACAI